VSSNPEIQARAVSTLLAGWVSIGLFFFLFDVVINPFRSPFQKEADIHMRAWSQSQGLVPPDEV
jgi:TM2 domain-containing membrane protein YozV